MEENLVNRFDYKHHKYIHILWQNELKFSTRIVSEFNNNDISTIESKEHYFVTPYIEVYDGLKEYPNVFFLEVEEVRSAKVVNLIGDYADFIFLHNICGPFELLKIKNKYAKKIIWRSWGGGRLNPIKYNKNYIKNIAKYFVNKLVLKKVKLFKAIGVANDVDIIELTDVFGTLNYFIQPYSFSGVSKELLECINSNKTDDCVKIMIGHSGFPDDEHINIAKKLEKYKNHNIKLFFVFSYGEKEYIDNCKNVISNTWGDKAEFIEQFMKYEDYVQLLSKMDIVFLAAPYSYALGNISILTYCNKKIFLNENGIIARAFQKSSVPYSAINDLDTMNYEEFIAPAVYKGKEWEKLSLKSGEYRLRHWEEIINFLNNKD